MGRSGGERRDFEFLGQGTEEKEKEQMVEDDPKRLETF
jgi:hypothetical protein